jgi:hypothetical protein
MSANQIARTPDYESCAGCGQIYPLSEFKDPGVLVCKLCSGKPDSEDDRAVTKRKVARLAARQVLASLTRSQIDVPHTSELAAAVVERIGGVDKLADKYMEVVNAILEKDPSTRLALSAVDGIAKMIRDSTVMRETAPDVNNLSDDELEQEISTLLEQRLGSGDIVLEIEQQDGESCS